MIKKITSLSAALVAAALLLPLLASAHVVVTPAKANIGEFQTFTISVPNEKDAPITLLKLSIPSGLKDVSPSVKTGWEIQVGTTGRPSPSDVTAITWSGGSIPAGQRDDFTFSAQLPAKATELQWKAYQTYADGTIVRWDQQPSAEEQETGNAGPYSITKVTNDLTEAPAANTAKSSSNNLPLAIAVLALLVSLAAILRPTHPTKR